MSGRRSFHSVGVQGRARTLTSLLRYYDAEKLGGRVMRHLMSTLVEYNQSDAMTSTNNNWKEVRRPLLDMELRRYAVSPVVPQPLILHGPRGVGKRTAIQGLLQEWRTPPHVVAYVDFYKQDGVAAENYKIPPWTLNHGTSKLNEFSKGNTDLGWIRRSLEQGLESLAMKAVEVGCLKSKNIFGFLVNQQAIDGALLEFLHSQATGSDALSEGYSGNTKQMWQDALLYMQKAAGHPDNARALIGIEEVLSRLLEGAEMGSLSTLLPKEVGGSGSRLRRIRSHHSSDGKLAMKEKAVLSLALAKHLLQIQEKWSYAAGSDRRNQGLIPKGVVNAAISWPALLFQLVSWATQEGLFQPKLVIHGMEMLRNSSMAMGGLDGSAYHDGFLLQLVNTSLTEGCFPTILVSSDSYYSWQLGDDFGSTDAFISSEIFGWTPKEAALHVVPAVFSAEEWKVVAAVLGSNPRHLVELQSIWNSQGFSECRNVDNRLDMEDCIDLYLGYLQETYENGERECNGYLLEGCGEHEFILGLWNEIVTAVDPAMNVAIGLLEQYVEKATKGHIDGQLLQHGAPWRNFPRTDDKKKHRQWARLQLMDFIQALAKAEFGVNYLGGGLEFLDDPAAHVLVEVGLFYQQRASPYVRPTSRGILRCLIRWLVREKLCLSLLDKARFKWHRLIRGRYYRHLMLDS